MAVNPKEQSYQTLVRSKDHKELLNIIDLLRSHGLHRYVHLPQIIVCGDQSSGKSSVLEAISGVRFPAKDNLCTRFATELILRRGSTESITVEIIPSAERSEEDRQKLSDFKIHNPDVENFPSLIEAAKEAMGIQSDTKAFSGDILRVEICGPEQPHLTLVDLPGLIHAENKLQSARDVEMVSSLVQSYMDNRRSIILAVVSARNDYANQIVTKLARTHDRQGTRTLGIITKPDTLYVGSESERAFATLARNEDVQFRLGWHVLKNRDYDDRDCSIEQRDKKEREFLSQGIWASLPSNILGIEHLKSRLSGVLRDQIIAELPSLLRDVEDEIDLSRQRLIHLGDSRGTLHEQQLYLIRTSQSFSSLVKDAIDGVYSHDFFGDAATQDGYSKRLRAVTRNLLDEFAAEIRVEGHHQQIIEERSQLEEGKYPKQILRSDFIEDVHELMKRSRGREVSGTFNPLIISDLFYHQSKPWLGIVERYSERILEAVTLSLEQILSHVTDEITGEGLLTEIVVPAMEMCTTQLSAKIREIMQPHQRGHPITHNRAFTDAIQKLHRRRQEKEIARKLNGFFGLSPDDGPTLIPSQRRQIDTGELLSLIVGPIEQDMDTYACSEAVDKMVAYYQVAMEVLIDNFTALGIENCLLDKLTNILTPEIVTKLDQRLMTEIAGETEDSKVERTRLQAKLSSLEKGLGVLNRLSHHKTAAGHFSSESVDAGGHELIVDDSIAGLQELTPTKADEPSDISYGASDTENRLPSPRIGGGLSAFDSSGHLRADDSWLFQDMTSPPGKKEKNLFKHVKTATSKETA